MTYHDGSDDSYGPELPKIRPKLYDKSRYRDARTDVEPTNTKMSKIQKQIEAEKWRQRSRAQQMTTLSQYPAIVRYDDVLSDE